MDWYPLWNSLRIAAVSCVIVFFVGDLCCLLCGKTSQMAQRDSGCTVYLAHGFASYCLWLFFAFAFWSEASYGGIFVSLWSSDCYDLVWWNSCFGSGGFSPHVPYSQGSF